MKTAIYAGLLILVCLPVVAGAPKGKHKPTTDSAAPASTVADALNQVAGKPQIVGITETNGTRFLGRVVSGDHALYVIQTFHFAGPPHITRQAATRTVGSGKKRHIIHGFTQTATETTLPDDEAVKLLLSGVAGATTTPLEVAGPRQMLAPSDVKFVQALTPPDSPKMPKPAAGQPVIVSPTAAQKLVWTITSLWPPAKADSATSASKP